MLSASFAPTYQKQLGDHWLLWFSRSNSYSIVTPAFKLILELYLNATNLDHFKAQLATEDPTSDANRIIDSIETYLYSCNQISDVSNVTTLAFAPSTRHLKKQYHIKEQHIAVYYDTEAVLNLIHPALAHWSSSTSDTADTTFDLFIKNKTLFLFKNEHLLTSAPARDYHVIQGKFIMHLLCSIHHNTEDDWLGTLHGSALTDGKSSILFVGESGKGKSTLCALLAQKGFDLLADDVSALGATDSALYYNPLAVSLKSGSFKLLEPLVPNFAQLPTVHFNPSKGPMKYLPCSAPKHDAYPCHTVILVNYQAHAPTSLEPVSAKIILETLIPESWLSPKPEHAKRFLEWLEHMAFYELTYSATDSVVKEISKLFKQERRKL